MKIQSIRIEIFAQKSKSSLVCTIYRPRENSKHLHENFIKLFDDMLSLAMRRFKELILLGHRNVNYLVKDDQNEIKFVISSHGIEQLIKQPTRFDLTYKTSTLIDIIRTNNKSNISSSRVMLLSIGDHAWWNVY